MVVPREFGTALGNPTDHRVRGGKVRPEGGAR
jgi:hypothetical protein